jgi:hypothetical protein
LFIFNILIMRKNTFSGSRTSLLCLTVLFFLASPALSLSASPAPSPLAAKQEFYSIRIYQLKNKEQEEKVDKYLKEAYLPALHRHGIPEAGVFKPIGNDTAAIRRIYVLIPFRNFDEIAELANALTTDANYLTDGKDYLNAAWDNPPYIRIESIILRAFPEMPRHEAPKSLTTPASEKIYELRSYESPTEKYHANKVQMFNEGGEVKLFKKLGFNAVFYGSVLSGAHMPNLMYMTSFENMASREQHWKTFGSDPFWKALSSSPEYQHNVSHNDIVFLHPTDYSDL